MSEIPTRLPLHTDELTRRLYASDASLYEELPGAVAFPGNGDQLAELITHARRLRMPITMRAAGTSLAGQTTGNGIIADISRFMNNILDIDPVNRAARVEPGVIRDQLNRHCGAYGLLFGPDTSTTNRCMLGGMIANNSCGSYSIKYGTTREHVLELDVTLSDGSQATFKALTETELHEKMERNTLEGHIYREMVRLLTDNRDLVFEKFPHPDVKRRNTGYALDKLCEMHPITPGGRPFNLCELLCGSEGTLALIRKALLNLVPVEKHSLLLIPQFNNLQHALESTVDAVAYDPAAVELVDEFILNATKGNAEQRRNRFFLQGDPKALLIIEFQGDDPEELLDRAQRLQRQLEQKSAAGACVLIDDQDEMSRVWDLRKAGLGLLMGYLSDSNSPEFVDDTAVRVKDLPAYIAEFREILKKHNTQCVFYAHASVGELHLRPILNIKTHEGIEKMKAIAGETADLVKKYRGSLSGEHGDGRLRSHLIERMMGPEILSLFRQVKELWDPEYLFNRGKILDPKPMDSDLRYSPSYREIEVDTLFHWRAENGFGKALELCNGAGVCRKKAESGGTMCPSYMATLEEKDSTRGRANLFRQIFSERQHDGFASDEIKEALELCLSCKACKTECPANVDMAKMKAEFTHGRHLKEGIDLATRFFGNPVMIYPLAGAFAPLVNFMNRLPPVKGIMEQLFNIHPDRNLPEFVRKTFTTEHQQHSPVQQNALEETGQPKVALVVDWFTDYHDPAVARAARDVLETLGCRVSVIGPLESGRTQLSRGLLDQAGRIAEKNIRYLTSYVNAGFRLVGLEPSEILTFRDEYPDLCSDELLGDAKRTGEASFMFEEFLADRINPETISRLFNGNGRKVHVHGHCHAKALTGTAPVLHALRRAGYEPVDLNTGCCGMAGSFGYDKNNYKVSMQIGELSLFPALRRLDKRDLICSPGFSCRHQITDGTGKTGLHTAQIIQSAQKYG